MANVGEDLLVVEVRSDQLGKLTVLPRNRRVAQVVHGDGRVGQLDFQVSIPRQLLLDRRPHDSISYLCWRISDGNLPSDEHQMHVSQLIDCGMESAMRDPQSEMSR